VRFLQAPRVAQKSFCENLTELPGQANPVRIGSLGPRKNRWIGMEAGATKEGLMKRITGAAIAIEWFAIAPDATAHARHSGAYGYYYRGPSFRGSPMYASNRAPPIKLLQSGAPRFSARTLIGLPFQDAGSSSCRPLYLSSQGWGRNRVRVCVSFFGVKHQCKASRTRQ
jgi:hypothetical protein